MFESFADVGNPVVRLDGNAKVAGDTRYTADLSLPGMIWGKVLRSPFPHARIVKIDTSRAESHPGVLAILTAKDIPDVLVGRSLHDTPILARDRARFIGEKVAAVAAEDPLVAEEVAALIDVEYEELPAVFDPLAAMKDDAPILHENMASYVNLPQRVSGIPNVHSHIQWRWGNCDQGFAESDYIFEQTFTTQRVHQGYLETHASVVQISPKNRILVWSSNKVPFLTRKYLAQAVEVEESETLVQLTSIGGDFGGKGTLMDIALCYHLAKATARPVKMVMNYFEELAAGNPRHPSVITIKTGVKKDGKLCAREVRAVFNSGAYGGFKPSPTVSLPGARHGSGPYYIPHVKIDALSVYTNSVPSGHMRGPGEPQMVFAVESHMDYIARKLGLDPFEFRRLNVLKSGESLPSGVRLENDKGRDLLDKIGAELKWGNAKEPYVGKGLALCVRDFGPGEANVEVGLKEDGTVYILTTIPDTGTGAHTIFRQIVGETLGISAKKIEVILGSTDSFPTDVAIGGSRITYLAGQAAHRGALELRQSLIEMAASRFQCPADCIRISKGVVWGPEKIRVPFSDLSRQAASLGKTLRVCGNFTAKDRTGTPSFYGQGAVVKVDPETGQIRILRIVSAHDVGTIINPVTHQGQIEGGMIQGLGFALMEELVDEEGKITTPNLGEYKLPNVVDIPPHDIVFAQDHYGPGPFQSKPIGENSICPTAAAIANAVYDAIGVQIRDLPLTAEKIYFALRKKRGILA